jgi:hypothetical protein
MMMGTGMMMDRGHDKMKMGPSGGMMMGRYRG